MNVIAPSIKYDARWETQPGIGRFARELRRRLPALVSQPFSGRPTVPSTACVWGSNCGIANRHFSHGLQPAADFTSRANLPVRLYDSRSDLRELSG